MAVHALKSVKDTSLYSEVYQQIGVGIAIYDVVDYGVVDHDVADRDAIDHGVDFRFVSMNPTALKISRATADDVLGKLLTECFPGAADMGILDGLRRVHATGNDESLPPLHYTDERTDAWYRNDLYRLPSGRLMAMYVDVTADVQAQRDLAESETRYALLTESLGDGIYDWNLRENSLYLSPSWKAQLGYADDELSNDFATWDRALHPDQRTAVRQALDEFLSSGERMWDSEFQLQHKDGSYRWIRTRATAVRDPVNGEVQRLLGVHMNVDAETREHLEIEKGRATIDAIVEAMPDMFFLLDSDGRIEDFRANNLSNLYRQPEDFLGRRMQEVLPADVAVGFDSALQEARLTGDLVTHEYSLPMIGGPQHYESRISCTREDHFAIMVRNVTQRHLAQQDLEDRVRETEGLYQLYQGIQRSTDIPELLRKVAPPILQATRHPQDLMLQIKIDDHTKSLGDTRINGRRSIAPIYDGDGRRGELCLTYPPSMPRSSDEQRLLNAAATAIALWLKSDNARESLAIYERIIDNTQNQLALVDHDLRYVVANDAYAARLGMVPGDLIGKRIRDVVAAAQHDTSKLEPRLHHALEGNVDQFQEWRDTPEGLRYMNMLYSPHLVDGQIRGVIISAHDITDLQQAQAQVRRAAQVFSNTDQGILMTEADGTITDINEAFTEICGFESDEVVGKQPSILDSGVHDAEFFEDMFRGLADEGRWHGEIWNKRRDGEVFPCLMTISPVENEKGDLTGYVGVFSDITAIKENEQRLETLANHDPLTGLPNRMQLQRFLDNRISRSGTRENYFSVLFIDLDRFKPVNDTLGHRAGDNLLQQVAQRLLAVLRVEDLLARVGGDEFVAVLTDMQNPADATVIADKIIDALAEPFSVSGDAVSIGASIGISSYPDDGEDTDSLLSHADTAMYAAKSDGRNRWRRFDHTLAQQTEP